MREGNYISIENLILKYFMEHPKEDLQHGPVVDWVETQYKNMYGKKPRDTWRAIRKLHQKGYLIKVKKCIYKYDPDILLKKEIFTFPPSVKEEIFKRDNYRCVVCGRGRDDGIEIHADHKIPLDKGGTNSLENGQTLYSEHNFLKKNYSQTEFGKRFIINLYKEAIRNGDVRIKNFCEEIFAIYDKYGIDTHIKTPNNEV